MSVLSYLFFFHPLYLSNSIYANHHKTNTNKTRHTTIFIFYKSWNLSLVAVKSSVRKVCEEQRKRIKTLWSYSSNTWCTLIIYFSLLVVPFIGVFAFVFEPFFVSYILEAFTHKGRAIIKTRSMQFIQVNQKQLYRLETLNNRFTFISRDKKSETLRIW